MNSLIEWWARNHVAANLLMIGILIAGILGFAKMEQEIDPTVQFNGLQIAVAWPGASPEEMEDQIVARIEESVRDMDNIDFVRSNSREGSASIIIVATDNVDFPSFMNDVRERVSGIPSLPRDIEPPRISRFINSDEYIRVALHGDIGERELKRLADVLRREMAQLPAISLVDVFGTRAEEVSIEVSENALRRYGLSFQDVADAIRNSSINLSTGTVRTEAGDIQLTARNRADDEVDFSKIIVRQSSDGGTLYLSDVATVKDGFEDNEILATLNGKPTALLQVKTTEVMQIVTASNAVKKWIETRSKTLPPGVKLTLWTDEAEAFKSRLATISSSALQGLLLVFIILLLTLRPLVAVWVTLGIATAYAGAFVLLPYVGVSLNMLSTFAFLLVLGIVVDDAIVVGEGIHAESHKTGGGMTAAVIGTQLVAKPVVFAVLTTIIAFLPWIFISGGTSEFTKHITWVVILALSFSLIESLFILPAHLSKMKPREKLGRFGLIQRRVASGIVVFAEKVYRPIGHWAVKRRYLTLSFFVGLLVVGFFGLLSAGYVKTGFLPDIEAEEINVDITLPDGTPYSRALEVLEQLQTAQMNLENEVSSKFGTEAKLIENWYTRSRRDNVLAIVKLAPAETRSLSAKETALRLRELIGPIPDAEEVKVRYTVNDRDPGMEFSVSHPDLDILRAATDDLKERLRTYDAIYDVRDDLSGSVEEIQFTLKPGAEKLGITLAALSSQIRQAYFGLEVQRLPRNGQDVKVMVRYPQDARRNIESLRNFRVRVSDGREVPLDAIASLEYAPGIKQIVRRDYRRAARVSADLKDDVRVTITEDLKKNFFPDWERRYPGVAQGAIGQAEGERRFFSEVITLYSIALFSMYMLLAIAFKSYSQPILFLVAIPYAVLGAVFGHLILGETLGIFSYFGIAAAAGVVINDNLVLIDYCNRLRERGMNGYEAAVEAGVARFRPILLTTMTTVAGLVPMFLERSLQAAFLKPVVIALMFGVIIALFVTLLLVPALYAIGVDIVAARTRARQRLIGLFKPNRPYGEESPSPNQAE